MPTSRTVSGYRSFSGGWIDSEKARNSDECDSDSTPSLVSSDQPMLGGTSPSRKKYALRYHLPRRRFGRYFTLIIGGTLILFAIYLIQMSLNSEAKVRMGLEKPPPPPPAWEQFPFLKRYHGGVRSLVRRVENVPEYPNDAAEEEELKSLQEAAMARKQKEDRINPKDKGFQKRDAKEGARTESRIPRAGRFDPYAAGESGRRVRAAGEMLSEQQDQA